MTPAQRRELELLAKRWVSADAVDGRSLPVLARNGWIVFFRGDSYSCRTITAITDKGREALAAMS